MSEPRHALVLAVFDAFRGAIEAREAAKAEQLASHAGWRGRAAGIGRFYRRAARLGQVPEPSDAVAAEQDRAVVAFTDGEGASRYACFVLNEERWQLEAIVSHPVRSALHLSGALAPLARLNDLPSSERAAAWARHVVGTAADWRPEIWPTETAGVAAVDTLQGLLGESGVRVDRTGAWDIPSVGRSIAGLRVTRRRSEAVDELWVVLDWSAEEGRLVLHHIEWTNAIDGALDGVAIQWDGSQTVDVEPEVTVSPSAEGYTPRELMAAFDAARRAFVEAGGATVDVLDLDALRRAFAQRVHSGTGSGGKAPALDMSGAVRDYLAEHGDDAEETVVDRAFVQHHASGVLNAMIGAFTKALIPETVEPVAGGKRVTVDVADLVGSLLPGQEDE